MLNGVFAAIALAVERTLGKGKGVGSNPTGGLPFGAKGLPEAWQLKRRAPVRRIVECAKVSVTITRSSLAEALALLGRVAEWLKAQHWKCCKGVTPSEVRILSPPPWRVKPIGDGTCLENS